MTGILRLQQVIRVSRSSLPVETTAFPGTHRPLPTCFQSAGLRFHSQAREATNPKPPGIGAAAAYSPYEPEPGYQSTAQTTGRRSTPDVSFDANPSTGVNIYETSPQTGQGSWRVYGGTSLGAPVWAGIMAIVDQGRALEGKGSLDGATQTIPSLYALPKSDFKSVVRNDGFLGTGGLSSLLGDLFGPDSNRATANIATGLGSPNGPSLIADLVASTITTSPFPASETGQSGTASSQPHITKPKKHAETQSTHRKNHHHAHQIRRHRAHSSSVARHRISAPGSRAEK